MSSPWTLPTERIQLRREALPLRTGRGFGLGSRLRMPTDWKMLIRGLCPIELFPLGRNHQSGRPPYMNAARLNFV
jgi:hypothetical protein